MKVHLSKIPEEGWQGKLSFPASRLQRLGEAFGEQAGTVEAEIGLKQRGGNVEVRGAFRVALRLPCHRCLEPVPFALDEPLSITLAPDQTMEGMEDETHLSAGDLEVSFFAGEEIDLVRVLEDEIFLILPDNVCPEDGQGRCSHCGKNVDEMFDTVDNDRADHPFAKLKDFLR